MIDNKALLSYQVNMKKNKFAVALGRLKSGVKEKKSELKRKTAAKNLKKARCKRWLKK